MTGPVASVLLVVATAVYGLYWLGSQKVSGGGTVSAIRLREAQNHRPYEIHGFKRTDLRP